MDRGIFIFLILVLAAIYNLVTGGPFPDAVPVIGWIDEASVGDGAMALALGSAARK